MKTSNREEIFVPCDRHIRVLSTVCGLKWLVRPGTDPEDSELLLHKDQRA